jgi:hypothetical protein
LFPNPPVGRRKLTFAIHTHHGLQMPCRATISRSCTEMKGQSVVLSYAGLALQGPRL